MKKWNPVPAMDFSALSPKDFDGISMDYRRNGNAKESMPYFLQNFSKVANSIIEDGPQRGYMDALIWRVASSNQPYNARVLESHLCISYFYCTKAKWNPYYGMEEVRVRLEAMLEYLLSLQLANGTFPEYGVAKGNLPATAFFTKFMSETIRLLKCERSELQLLSSDDLCLPQGGIHRRSRRCDSIGPPGQFCEAKREGLCPTEVNPKEFGRAKRGFAVHCKTSERNGMKNGPPFDAGLFQKMVDANRKAIYVVLTDEALIRHGWSYSNQFTNVWAGGLAHISMFPDAEIEDLLLRSMKDETYGKFQSEAGFYYECDQPDWGYTLRTHNSNDRYAWFFAKGTPFEALLAEHTQRYYDWLSYNCLREPDGSGFLFNRAIESRQRLPFIDSIETEIAENVELARAFAMDKDELAANAKARQDAWAEKWPVFTEANINRGNSFTPYSFLFESIPKWNPTKEEKALQVKQLPYLKSRRFIHQRMDYRTQLVNLYIRRDSYYCAFNSGASLTDQQRFGLGFLWDDEAGMLVQSQSGNDLAVWGFSQNGKLYEKSLGIRMVYYKLDGRRTSPVIGSADWEDKVLTVEYQERGENREICFEDDRITVSNCFKGELTEYIPLTILPDDQMSWGSGLFTLRRGNRVLTISFDDNCKVGIEMHGKCARYQVAVLMLSAADGIKYEVKVRK